MSGGNVSGMLFLLSWWEFSEDENGLGLWRYWLERYRRGCKGVLWKSFIKVSSKAVIEFYTSSSAVCLLQVVPSLGHLILLLGTAF